MNKLETTMHGFCAGVMQQYVLIWGKGHVGFGSSLPVAAWRLQRLSGGGLVQALTQW